MPEQAREQHIPAQTSDFARQVLAELGVTSAPLTPAGGWSNAVWCAPTHVVRISSGRFARSFAHEIATLQLLPATVPYARVCAYGQVGPREWMIQERVPGETLFDAWPTLTPMSKRVAITQLGAILRALHDMPFPARFANPWATTALLSGGQPQNAYHPPPAQYAVLIEAVLRIPDVNPAMIHAAGAFIEARLPAFEGDTLVLVHDDIHFSNIIWADGAITALLDFEGAKVAPADQELDTLLRFVREPEDYRGPHQSQRLTTEAVRDMPQYLRAAYPALFLHPRHNERLAVYEALWQLVQLLNFAATDGVRVPYDRLTALLREGERWRAY